MPVTRRGLAGPCRRGQHAATLEVYEAPIDALSGATLRLLSGNDWRIVHYIALGGLSHLQLSHDP